MQLLYLPLCYFPKHCPTFLNITSETLECRIFSEKFYTHCLVYQNKFPKFDRTVDKFFLSTEQNEQKLFNRNSWEDYKNKLQKNFRFFYMSRCYPVVAELISEFHILILYYQYLCFPLSIYPIFNTVLSYMRCYLIPVRYYCELTKFLLSWNLPSKGRDWQEEAKKINHMKLPLGVHYLPETITFEWIFWPSPFHCLSLSFMLLFSC